MADRGEEKHICDGERLTGQHLHHKYPSIQIRNLLFYFLSILCYAMLRSPPPPARHLLNLVCLTFPVSPQSNPLYINLHAFRSHLAIQRGRHIPGKPTSELTHEKWRHYQRRPCLNKDHLISSGTRLPLIFILIISPTPFSSHGSPRG